MSKTARPARPTTARKRTAAKPAAKRKPAARTRTTTRKAPGATKPPAKKRAAPAAEKRAEKPPAEKRTPKPRLPAHVKAAIAAAQDKQALDLTVLDLRNATAFTDFFIVCTGANVKHVQAIADGVEAGLRAAGEKPALVEGYRKGEWVLLDYLNYIVHVFLPTRRTFYALERLWGGAEPIEVSAP
jgi:ribosome-associated protein